MNISEPKIMTVPEIAVIAVTRGAIGFGAGLLLASKLKRERRKQLGWNSVSVGACQHNSNRYARIWKEGGHGGCALSEACSKGRPDHDLP
jgi:hypothetical protein